MMTSNHVRIVGLSLAALLVNACEPTTTPAPADLELLSVDAASLPADGEAITTVRAVIPPDSRVAPRQVTFSTSAGTFEGGGQQTTVPVGPSGQAFIVLRAGTAPTLAIVSAQAGRSTLQDSIRFVSAPPSLHSFTISQQTVPADSHTTVVLRVLIAGGETVQPRRVTFLASAGAFVGGVGGNGAMDSVLVLTTGSGEAIAVLRAPPTPALSVVRARLGTTELRDTVRFSTAPPQLQTLSISARELPADGASTITARGVLSSTAVDRTVEFQTTGGALIGPDGKSGTAISVAAGSTGVASVLLRADTALGTALIRARAGATVLIDSVRLVPALADQIAIAADSFTVVADPARPIALRATLSRLVGRVTPGTTVSFAAATPDGTPLGWFGNVTATDRAGQVTALYTPGSTAYRGPVVITASTIGTAGSARTSTLTLEVR